MTKLVRPCLGATRLSSGDHQDEKRFSVQDLTGAGGDASGGTSIGQLREMVSAAVTLKKSQGDLVSSSLASSFRSHYSTLSPVRCPLLSLEFVSKKRRRDWNGIRDYSLTIHDFAVALRLNRRPSSGCSRS